MSMNAYESLQALFSNCSAVSFDVAALATPHAISEFKTKLQTARAGAISPLADQQDVITPILGVPYVDFFADCAVATCVASAMQRALSETLQGRHGTGAVSQENTHLLVDLWGQIEASKALYEFVARQLGSAADGQGDRMLKGVSLRAQCRVLSGGLEQVLLMLAMKLGDHHSLASVADIIDWTVKQLRAPAYQSLREAINEELYGLVA
jgi:hypothetical protein